MMAQRCFDVPCEIAVEQTEDHFHAHVELADNVQIEPGDRVRVHGDPIQIRFGERVNVSRMATVTRAGPLLRSWTRLAAYFDLKELYEVSFNPGRVR
jgi:hypothetical protein